jgi:hypothetical protein
LIRFTQPKALNDPFEMRPHIAGYGTAEELHKIATRRWDEDVRQSYDDLVGKYGPKMTLEEFKALTDPSRESAIEKAKSQAPEYNLIMGWQIDKLLNESVGVLSLCEHPKNLLMWPHYADSHRGFVIEFDTSSPFFNQTSPPAHVEFSAEETAMFVEEYGRLRKISYKSARPSQVVTALSFDVIMTKSEDWKYEGEWRMLMPPQYANSTLPTDRGAPLCLFAVPPNAITKIMLGVNADETLHSQALQLRDQANTQHIVIEKGRIDEERFLLHFEPI